VVTVGGVDTYYDYDEQRWKYRRLGGGPVHDKDSIAESDVQPTSRGGHPAKRVVVSAGQLDDAPRVSGRGGHTRSTSTR
jgi:hypothetical protein